MVVAVLSASARLWYCAAPRSTLYVPTCAASTVTSHVSGVSTTTPGNAAMRYASSANTQGAATGGGYARHLPSGIGMPAIVAVALNVSWKSATLSGVLTPLIVSVYHDHGRCCGAGTIGMTGGTLAADTAPHCEHVGGGGGRMLPQI